MMEWLEELNDYDFKYVRFFVKDTAALYVAALV